MSLFRRRDQAALEFEPEETAVQTSSGVGRTLSAALAQPDGRAENRALTARTSVRGEGMAHIGKAIAIRGDLTGEEDLLIEGRVEGKVELPKNAVTIGQHGRVRAEVHAKSVTVIGRVAGNVLATERVEIQATGIVEGDVRAPRLVVQEGAVINGVIEMTGRENQARTAGKDASAAASPTPQAPASKVARAASPAPPTS